MQQIKITNQSNVAKVFKREILDRVKSDADLFALVSKALGVKPTSLTQTLDRNGNALNQYHVVKAVADYLQVSPEDILEEVAETARA